MRNDVPWGNVSQIEAYHDQCGHCGSRVASDRGWKTHEFMGPSYRVLQFRIHLCPYCYRPTFFVVDTSEGKTLRQIPSPLPGEEIDALPDDIRGLYTEIRKCIQAEAYTAAVLASRKLIMHLAVEKGADPGLSFVNYVQYLGERGYVPPEGREWVDHIRRKGNEANHEIVLMDSREANRLLDFIEMLLRFMYEFPARFHTEEEESGS